ncbi:MAG: hypothetical protein ABID61_04275 [Candidatus Micrarchaeota archaeon]
MERKLSWPIYIAAFVFTLLIFAIGIYVGHMVDLSNVSDLSGQVSQISQRVNSLHLLFLMDENSSAFCPVFKDELNFLDSEMETIGHKLSFLEERKNVLDVKLKKEYFLLEAESYLLSQKLNLLCHDNTTLLVYFYSNTNCSTCNAQGGNILDARDEVVKQNKNIKLYSFDGDLGSTVANALKLKYNITSYPSIVVDEQLYSGLRSRDDLVKLLGG